MPNHNRERILEEISNWSTDDVVKLLQKNKLSECCDAVVKRQVDGEGLLHLSERNLNLWKSDLTSTLRWKLCRFVEELNNNPTEYFRIENKPTSPSVGELDGASDSDWDTEFEDEEDSTSNGDSIDCSEMYSNGKSRPPLRVNRGITGNQTPNPAEEDDDEANIYENGAGVKNGSDIVAALQEQLLKGINNPPVGPKQPIMGHKSRVVARNLEIMNQNSKVIERKPQTIAPRAKMAERTPKIMDPKVNRSQEKPRIMAMTSQVMEMKARFSEQKPKTISHKPDIKEFVKNKPMPLNSQQAHSQQPSAERIGLSKRMPSPELNKKILPLRIPAPNKTQLPPKPKDSHKIQPAPQKKLGDLPKPPPYHVRIGKLEFGAELPQYEVEDSDGCVYEPVQEEKTMERRLSGESTRSFNSTHSSAICGRSVMGSNESVNYPQDAGSTEDIQDADVYESIPEKVDDEYVPPIFNRNAATLPGPTAGRLRPKDHKPLGRQLLGGLGSRLADEVADMIVRIKRGLLRCCHEQPRESPENPEPPTPPERPEGKKFATLPHAANQSTRPLPSPPSDQRPWFHEVTREEAIAMIEGGPSNPRRDGYFLVRPSNANVHQPGTLVLWYRNKTYNIAVRRRPDSRYALGKVKLKEKSFASIEEMVDFYQYKEELVLTSAGGDAQVGSTRLTDTPPKRNN